MIRRRFRERGSPISFFAFQDIITSVSGILIIITLLLSLQIGGSTSDPLDESASDAHRSRLSALLEELSTLRRAATVQAQVVAALGAPEELAARTARIREEIDALQARNAVLDAQAAAMAKTPGSEERSLQMDALSKSIQPRREEISSLEAAAKELQMKASDAAAAVRSAQDRLLAEQQRKNVLQLIPEPSASNREPVIVELGLRRWRIQRFDTREVSAGTDVQEFRSALKAYAPLKQYFVFYGKPSAADDFSSYVDSARSAGFGVGYDLIAEDAVIELNEDKSQ